MTDATAPDARPQGGVSPIFLGLVTALGVAGWLLATDRVGAVGVFAFVLVGWIVSLCLHEFGHAAAAYAGGDRSVVDKGYLTLDPLRYANPALSIVLPLLFLAMGGVGFPGGAVYVNPAAIRTPLLRSAMSLAGPAMNLACLVVIALTLPLASEAPSLAAALAFLGLLQATALVLNLLPIPGLDGFGVLSPFLPPGARAAAQRVGNAAGLVLLAAIFALPQLLDPIWSTALSLTAGLGVDPQDTIAGYRLFRFWDLRGQGEAAG